MAMDFVVTWVDGSDPAWLAEKRKYQKGIGVDDTAERYRDWGLLRYWFRGVEKNAPWVRKVHFLTWGHVPDWLCTDHPKLHIVRHEEFIPSEFLPTFNSHTIEWNMHRVGELSEQFVYFNDDMFLINRVAPDDFFKNGKPRDMLAFQPVVANPANPVMSHIYLNNTLVLSKYFNKRENVRRQPGSYFRLGYPPLYFFYNMLELAFPLFTGFYTVHGPSPFFKRTFEAVWEKEEELLRTVCGHRFREEADVSQYLLREWQKLSGDFSPANIQRKFRYFNLSDHNAQAVRMVKKGGAKIACLNDANVPIDFDAAKRELSDAFAQRFPEKSGFEK